MTETANAPEIPQVFVREDGTPMNIYISLECPARTTFVKMVQVSAPPKTP